MRERVRVSVCVRVYASATIMQRIKQCNFLCVSPFIRQLICFISTIVLILLISFIPQRSLTKTRCHCYANGCTKYM